MRWGLQGGLKTVLLRATSFKDPQPRRKKAVDSAPKIFWLRIFGKS